MGYIAEHRKVFKGIYIALIVGVLVKCGVIGVYASELPAVLVVTAIAGVLAFVTERAERAADRPSRDGGQR